MSVEKKNRIFDKTRSGMTQKKLISTDDYGEESWETQDQVWEGDLLFTVHSLLYFLNVFVICMYYFKNKLWEAKF